MNGLIRSICLIFAVGLAVSLTEPVPGTAHDANTAPIDCSKGSAMMMQPNASMQGMKSSGDVDKDFANSMMIHNRAMMAMMRMEIACGKDAKTMALAKKMLDEETSNEGLLRQLIGGGG